MNRNDKKIQKERTILMTINVRMFFFSLLVLSVVTLLFFVLTSKVSASDTDITKTDGPASAEPRTSVSFSYTITNNGSASTRYNISYEFEFAWRGVVESITYQGADMNFNTTEYGIVTPLPLPPGESIGLVFTIHVPALTKDQDLNQKLGLEAGTRATVSLFVSPLSQDGEMGSHFSELTVLGTHDLVLQADRLKANLGTTGPLAKRTSVFFLSVVHVTNTEDTDGIALQLLEGGEEGWSVHFSDDLLPSMEKFEQRNVTLSVTAPQGFVVTDEREYWLVTIKGESLFSLKNVSLEFNITLEKEGGVNLYTNEARHRVVTPGVETIFNVTLQNVGNYEDNFSLSFQAQHYSYWIRLDRNVTGKLSVLENCSVHVIVLVSDAHPPLKGSKDTIELRAVSLLSQGLVSDSLLLSFEFGEKINVSVTPEKTEYLEAGGKNITIPVLLRNTGNCEASFSLELEENVSYRGERLASSIREKRLFPWKNVLSVNSVYLKADESKTVTLVVTTPRKGFYTESDIITITATYSGSGELVFSNSSSVNVSITKSADFVLSMVNASAGGIPGDVLEHTLDFTSSCNFPLKVVSSTRTEENRRGGGDGRSRAGETRSSQELELCSLSFLSSQEWPVNLEFPASITLGPFESVLLHFESTIQPGAVNGTINNISANLDFTTSEYSISKTTSLSVVVKQFFKLGISCPNSEHKIVPGGTTNFEIFIHNEGNGIDTVLLNVAKIPDQFNSVSKNALLTVDPFSSQNFVLTLSMAQLSDATPEWNSKHRVKIVATSQLNASSRSEFYTPWMSVSFLGVFEAEAFPQEDIETLYEMDGDTGELNDVVTDLETYIYNNRTIAIPLRIYNLGFGNGTKFIIRDMILQPFLSYSLMDTSFNEIKDTKIVLDNFQERKVYLLFTTTDFNITVALANPPLVFRMHIENDVIENGKSITNSFVIRFHYLKLDIWLDRLQIKGDVIEGRTVTISTILYLSEGEIGSGMINSGIERIDKVKEIVIKLYQDNTLLTTVVIPELTIAEREEELNFRWEIPDLEWYEKERGISLKAVVADYQCYQGYVDFNNENNRREDQFAIQDATVIDITSTNRYIAILIHLVLLGFLAQLILKVNLKLDKRETKLHYARLTAGSGLATVLFISLLFSFPWHIFYSTTGQTINRYLNIIFFLVFPLAAYQFGKLGRSKKRIVLAGILAVLIVPLFMSTIVLGAVFWRGVEESLYEFYTTLITGNFYVADTERDIYLYQLVPFYVIITFFSCHRTYRATQQIVQMIKKTEEDIKNTRRKIETQSRELVRGMKRRVKRPGGGGAH